MNYFLRYGSGSETKGAHDVSDVRPSVARFMVSRARCLETG